MNRRGVRMRLLFSFTALLSACGDKEPVDDTQDEVREEDGDGDGFVVSDDCDDADPTVGGEEVPFDGVDNDCDPGTPDDDGDGDGVAVADDCDDNNPLGWLAPDVVAELTEDVMDFCAGYCERSISGDCELVGVEVEELASMRCLTSVGGDLLITTSVRSLSGLENLTSVGDDLTIRGGWLESLEGLDGLTSVGGMSRSARSGS